MKFAKYLETESVPEWRSAYVDYKGMKKAIKRISLAAARTRSSQPVSSASSAWDHALPTLPSENSVTAHAGSDECSMPDLRAVATVSLTADDAITTNLFAVAVGEDPGAGTRPSQQPTIMATLKRNTSKLKFSRNRRSPRASPNLPVDLSLSLEDILQTRRPEERQFFEKLDNELEKVVVFYKQREAEATKTFNDLVFQTKILNAASRKDDTKPTTDNAVQWMRLHQSAWGLVKTGVNNIRETTREVLDMSPSAEATIELTQRRRYSDGSIPKSTKPPGSEGASGQVEVDVKGKVRPRTARVRLKRAILAFYNYLIMLKNFKLLNQAAFAKILKKFDKAARWRASDKYMQKVHYNPIVTSMAVDNLITKVERLYSSCFEGGERREAMRKLRVPDLKRKTHHMVAWRTGVYVGMSLPAILYILTVVGTNGYPYPIPHLQELIIIYSGFTLPIIFLMLFSCNIYVWTKCMINYRFIFEFEPRDNLDFRQFLEFPCLFLFLLTYTVFFNIHYSWFDDWIEPTAFPALFFSVSFLLLFLPAPVFYHTSRRWIVHSLSRILFSGFKTVEFRDFFVTDELNSLVYFFVSLQTFSCTYSHNWAVDVESPCTVQFSWVTPFVSMLPGVWRTLQCLRRYRDTRQAFPHLVNAGKYITSITVVLFSAAMTLSGIFAVKVVWIVLSVIATVYTYCWDIFMDWGLGDRRSRNPMLRNELVYSSKKIYYFAMISNFFLRISWVYNIAPNTWRSIVDNHLLVYIIAVLEVLRRFQWNFFRLENEHVNNCGQFRATKEIPLPFAVRRYSSSDDIGDRSENDPTENGRSLSATRLMFDGKAAVEAEQDRDRRFHNRRDFEARRSRPEDRVHSDDEDDGDETDR